MNIFKINKSFALNLFSFSGYLTPLWIPWLMRQNILGLAILFYVYLGGVLCPWLVFLLFIAVIEYFLKGRKLSFDFNDKYKNNLFAKIYFWLGILLNLLFAFIAIFYLTGLFIFIHYPRQ